MGVWATEEFTGEASANSVKQDQPVPKFVAEAFAKMAKRDWPVLDFIVEAFANEGWRNKAPVRPGSRQMRAEEEGDEEP